MNDVFLTSCVPFPLSPVSRALNCYGFDLGFRSAHTPGFMLPPLRGLRRWALPRIDTEAQKTGNLASPSAESECLIECFARVDSSLGLPLNPVARRCHESRVPNRFRVGGP
jgi:hypothetical protein